MNDLPLELLEGLINLLISKGAITLEEAEDLNIRAQRNASAAKFGANGFGMVKK